MPEFAYGSGLPVPVPPMKPEQLAEDVTLIRPLSRKGVGPGMIVLAPNDESGTNIEIQDGIPSLRMKWAEEGYCVVEIRPQASSSALKTAVAKLGECYECEPKEKIGLACYDIEMWSKAASAMETLKDRIACAAIYGDASKFDSMSTQSSVPTIYHITGKSETKRRSTPGSKVYEYGTSRECTFPVPFHKDFHYATEAVSHSRNLSFFKPLMGGPYFDLELLWDEHTYYEFEARNVEATMTTMVQEPYVNHVPTLTGGIGREKLTDFYTNHFIFSNPKDATLELLSRTVGIDRVVDEFAYNVTHDITIDWLLPGVPPTCKKLSIPMMAVVNIRGDRLYHEHIHWDSASALRQVGLLPEMLPLSLGGEGASGVNGHTRKNFEVVVPAAGIETVEKMRDKNAVESNQMFEFRAKEL